MNEKLSKQELAEAKQRGLEYARYIEELDREVENITVRFEGRIYWKLKEWETTSPNGTQALSLWRVINKDLIKTLDALLLQKIKSKMK